MEVFANRVRRAYIRKRSTREMAVATLGFALFILLLGLAGHDQVREEEAMKDLFTHDRRVCIVEWATSAPVYELGK